MVISPHLDDAVYSAWTLLQDAQSPLVVTACAGVPTPGTPPSRYDTLTGSNDPHERMLERRREDKSVLDAHGWNHEHLEFLDAPYRERPHNIQELSTQLASCIPPDTHVVAVPAAIGLHEDHLAVRDAALLALRDRPVRVVLYADLPYATYFGWPHWVVGDKPNPLLDVDSFYDRALSGVSGWKRHAPEIVRLDETSQRQKLGDMQGYRSQFPAMESGPSRGLSHPARISFELRWDLDHERG